MTNDIFVVIEHLRGSVSDITYIMLAAAHDLVKETGGRVIGILLGNDAQGLISNLAADEVIYVDHPALSDFSSDGYQRTLSNLISEHQPRVAFFGNTTIGADIASVISARLGLQLINSCQKITSINGRVISVCQICGGKIMVEVELPDENTLITMIPGGYKSEEGQSDSPPKINTVSPPELDDLRTSLIQYIEPEEEDIDIANEPILISVGRGIQTEDNIELAEELAELMDGVLCASRPIVDQGWLPTSRMVGKSGKRVKAKLYLALGISGAPEHVEGITDCETIIAINTDPSAPIFDIAKYGAEVDLLDLVEELIDLVEEAKG